MPPVSREATLKLQPHLLQRELSLTEAPEVPHTITRRSLRPLGPANLTAQGDGVAPTYSAGQSVTLAWTLTSEDQMDGDPTVDYDTRADRCVLELWVGGGLRKTLYVSKTPPCVISNASLVAYLGSHVTFTVRAYLARGGYRSLDHDTITVTRI